LQGSSLSESKNFGYYQKLVWIITYRNFSFLQQVLLHMLRYFLLQIIIVCRNVSYYGLWLLRSLYKLSFLLQKICMCIKFDLLLNAVITWIMFVFLLKIFVAQKIIFIQDFTSCRFHVCSTCSLFVIMFIESSSVS